MTEETSQEVTEETVVETTPEVTEQEPSSEQVETPEEQPLYAGKYKSPEELEKAYKESNAANSKMAQELAEAKKTPLPADKQQIVDELKSLGFTTNEQLTKNNAVQTQQAKDNVEIQGLGINQSQETILRNYANSGGNLNKTMTECWNELQTLSGDKIVSRKTTIKPKSGSKTGFVVKSSEELAKLPKPEYDKYWADYQANAGN